VEVEENFSFLCKLIITTDPISDTACEVYDEIQRISYKRRVITKNTSLPTLTHAGIHPISLTLAKLFFDETQPRRKR
jgi:hypothetical protein